MKVLCPCGTVISDTTDALPYKAYLRSDQDEFAYQDILVRDARALARSFRDEYSDDVAENMLQIALQEFGLSAAGLERAIYECPDCGRMLIRSRYDAMKFECYLPESEVRGVLMSISSETVDAP